jgi:formylglycine-generating enzyme
MTRSPHLLGVALAVWCVAGWSSATDGAERASRDTSARAKDGLDYVAIGPGSFDMGCAAGDSACDEDEKPRHRVELPARLWVGRTEVTVAAFGRFVADARHRTTAESDGWSYVLEGRITQKPGVKWDTGSADEPVSHVSWYDAVAYCAWSGGRLPTEAEWEYAARGGITGARHVWGDAPTPQIDGAKQANVWDEAAKKVFPATKNIFAGYDDGFVYRAPAATFVPNRFGLHDLAGNVMEWCADWYNKLYYASSPAAAPKGPPMGGERVLRGGSWNDGPTYLRLSDRFGNAPALHGDNIGFRCARDVPP